MTVNRCSKGCTIACNQFSNFDVFKSHPKTEYKAPGNKLHKLRSLVRRSIVFSWILIRQNWTFYAYFFEHEGYSTGERTISMLTPAFFGQGSALPIRLSPSAGVHCTMKRCLERLDLIDYFFSLNPLRKHLRVDFWPRQATLWRTSTITF